MILLNPPPFPSSMLENWGRGGHERWGKVQVSVHHGEGRETKLWALGCPRKGQRWGQTPQGGREACFESQQAAPIPDLRQGHSCIGKHYFWSASAPLWVLFAAWFAFCFSLTFPSPSPFIPLLLLHRSLFSHKSDCLCIHLPMFRMNFPSALKFSCTFQTPFPLNPTKSRSDQSYLQSNPHHPLLLNDFTLSCVLVYLGCILLLINITNPLQFPPKSAQPPCAAKRCYRRSRSFAPRADNCHLELRALQKQQDQAWCVCIANAISPSKKRNAESVPSAVPGLQWTYVQGCW